MRLRFLRSSDYDRLAVDLKAIYLTTLQRCAPDVLVRSHIHPGMPRNVVAIGKCAGALLDGVASAMTIDNAFAVVPAGYPRPAFPATVRIGGHPQMTPASFEAGDALLEFVDAHHDILFLVSGGGSACVEVAAPPFSMEEVIAANAALVGSGLPIGAINAERRRRSAIKGGRLAARVRGRAVTLIYSDVATGAIADVASGPTLPGSAAQLIADNATLVGVAAQLLGSRAVPHRTQIEGDVEDAAQQLASLGSGLEPGQVLVAGGEPTVVVRGAGKGGRCSELAVRFAHHSPFEALFAGSDGVDGNTEAAGIHLPAAAFRGQAPEPVEAALARSDSYSIGAQLGEPIMIAPTGNNLRDLFLVARP